VLECCHWILRTPCFPGHRRTRAPTAAPPTARPHRASHSTELIASAGSTGDRRPPFSPLGRTDSRPASDPFPPALGQHLDRCSLTDARARKVTGDPSNGADSLTNLGLLRPARGPERRDPLAGSSRDPPRTDFSRNTQFSERSGSSEISQSSTSAEGITSTILPPE
jgi:hypothetical protein